MNRLPLLKPGDIILLHSDSWMGRVIRWFEAKQTGHARVQHAAMALGGLMRQPAVLEALATVRRTPLSRYTDQQIIIYRHKHLPKAARCEIALEAVTRQGEPYAVLKLLLLAADALTGTTFFSRTFKITKLMVCSNVIAWAYERVLGFQPFNLPWQSVTPDHIDDTCSRNPEDWECLYDSIEENT
jgi:hypothetical protein